MSTNTRGGLGGLTLLAAALLLPPCVVHGADKAPSGLKVPAGPEASPAPKSVHDIVVKTIDGSDFSLRKLENRILLFVNVASQ